MFLNKTTYDFAPSGNIHQGQILALLSDVVLFKSTDVVLCQSWCTAKTTLSRTWMMEHRLKWMSILFFKWIIFCFLMEISTAMGPLGHGAMGQILVVKKVKCPDDLKEREKYLNQTKQRHGSITHCINQDQGKGTDVFLYQYRLTIDISCMNLFFL